MEAGKNNEYGEPNACGLGPFGLRHGSTTNSSTKHLRPRWRDPMIFVREASAAVVLVTLTLSLQCAGMAALIGRARTSLTRDIHKLGPLRSAVFMVRFTTFIIALHVLQILLWAGFYRWLCFPLWESAFYFSTSSYATVGYGDVVLPWMWRAWVRWKVPSAC